MKLFSSLSRRLPVISYVAILLLFASVVSSADEEEPATCKNDDANDGSCENPITTAGPKPTTNKRRPPPNTPISAIFQNLSSHRVDVHFDDGRFGKVVGTADSGHELQISTFVNHRFFVTLHGVREGLVDPKTDEQYFFTITNENNDDGKQTFTIPKTAAPSTTLCKDRYPVCVHEAARGECTRNPGWMIVNCCKSCDDTEGYGYLIDSDVRCDPKRLNSTVPAWKSGSLDEVFTKWATEEEYKQYEPVVVSSPDMGGPWIMTFDNFLDDFEVEQLLHGASYGEGFQRSTDQGKIISGSGEMVKVTSKTRTSSNAWCRTECENLPGVKRVTDRIEEVRVGCYARCCICVHIMCICTRQYIHIGFLSCLA